MFKRRFLKVLSILLISVSIFVLSVVSSTACTSLMAGKNATADGSVLYGYCNDGNILSWLEIVPAMEFPEGTTTPILVNQPIPPTLDIYNRQILEGYKLVGQLPLPKKTYQNILFKCRIMGRSPAGINEYGVTIGAEYTPFTPEITFSDEGYGAYGASTNHWTTSLVNIALRTSKTAREAITVMTSLAEKYGFRFYFSATAGLSFPIVDKNEAWVLEMFPAGPDWVPGSDKPGAVWCAERIPDDEVCIYANRSRIQEINLDDPDHFMASPNIYSLAKKLGIWDPNTKFNWREVYGQPGSMGNILREWTAFNKLAPSQGFKVTGDSNVDQYPWSFKPDKPVTFQNIVEVMRSQLEGTKWDVTEDSAFQVNGEKSPLARFGGGSDLFDLVGTKNYRTIATDSTSQWFVAHLRNWLPKIVSPVVWYGLGGTNTSVITPIYPSITKIPPSWSTKVDFSRVNRDQTAWNFCLVRNLGYIKYQEAIKDIKAVIEPTEERFSEMLPGFEDHVIDVYNSKGYDSANEILTNHCYYWLKQVHNTYNELVDYMLYKYVFPNTSIAPPTLPQVVLPAK